MGKTYYITQSGVLKREHGTVVLRADGKKPVYIPINDIDDIFVFSEITLNKRLLSFLRQQGVPIHFYDRVGYIGSFMPEGVGQSSHVFIKQVEYYADESKRIEIARIMTHAMIKGIENTLYRWYRIGKIKKKPDLHKAYYSLEKAQDIDQVRQAEASARKMYYEYLGEIVPSFEGRSRRPPKNSFNALMSFAYALLYGAVLTAIFQSPLDAKVSYIHEPKWHLYPLRLDMADLFKVPIVDRFLVDLYKEGQVKPGWFVTYGDGVFLSMNGKREFLKHWRALMKKRAKKTKYGRAISVRRLFYIECMKLVRYLVDGRSYCPYMGE